MRKNIIKSAILIATSIVVAYLLLDALLSSRHIQILNREIKRKNGIAVPMFLGNTFQK